MFKHRRQKLITLFGWAALLLLSLACGIPPPRPPRPFPIPIGPDDDSGTPLSHPDGEFPLQLAGVNSVSFDPTGRWMATAGDDGVVTIWDFREVRLALRMRGHSGAVTSVAFAASNPSLADLEGYPPDISLTSAKSRQRLVVQATYSDGITRDVTDQATYKFVNPRLARHCHPPITNGSRIAVSRLNPKAQRKRTARSGNFACFQRAMGPTPIKNIAGAISGTNTVLKYGGPTESLPRFRASTNNG